MPYFPLTMCEPKRSEDEENVDPGHRKGNINSSVTTSTRICKVRTTHMSEHVNGKVYNNNRDPANVQECKIKRVRAHVSGEKNNRVVVDGINLDESANQSSGDKDTMHKSPRRSKKTSAMKHKPPLTERQQVALLLKDQAQKQPAPAVQAVSAVSEPDEISRFAEKFLCTPRPVLPSHKKTSPVHKYVSATNVPLQVKAVDPKLAPLIKIVRPRTAATNRLNVKNQKGETQLQRAAIRGDKRLVDSLLKRGANVNSSDNAGWTSLHEASNHGHTEIVRLLLLHGAKPDKRGLGGDMPLHDAAANGHMAIARMLVQYGASVLATNDDGITPLDSACSVEMLDYLRDQLVSTTDTPASSTEHSAPQTEKNPEKLSLSDSSSDRAQTTETPQLSDTSPEKDCSCETPQLSDVCQTRLTPELSDLRQSDMSMSPESAQQGTAGDCLTAVKSGRKATDHDRHHAEHGSTDLHSPVDMQKTSNTTLDTESMGAAYVYAKPASAHEPSHTDSNQRVDTNGMLSRTYSVSSMADVKATPQPTPTVKSKVGRSQARTPAYAPTPQRSSAQTPISHANTSDSGVKLAGNTKTSANRVTDPRNGPQGTPMCTPTPTRALQTPPSSVYPHTNTHTRTYTHTGTGIGTGTFVHPTPSNSSLVLDSGIMVGPKTLKRHNDDNSSTQKRHRNESSFKFASPLKNRPGDTRTSPSASTTDSKAHASTRTRTECSTDADPSTSVGARETRMEASLESGRDNQPTNGMHMNMDLLLQAARLSGARDEACAPHTSTHTYRLETCVGHAHNTLAQRDGKDKATRGVKMAGDTNTRAGDALAPGSCYEVGALTGVGGGGCREGSTREEEVVTGDGWQAPRSSSAETGTVATGEKAHRKAPAATDTVTPDDTGSSINRTERESIDRMEKEKSTETGTSTQSRCTSMADNETRMDDNGTGIAKSGTSAPDSDTTAASSNLLLVSLPNAVGSSRGRPHSPGEREKTNRKRSKNRTASQELSRERAKKDALLHVKTTDTSRSRSRSRSPGIVTKWSGTSQGYATSNEETECRSKNTFITQPIKTKTSKHHRTLTVSSHRSKGSLSGLDTEQICDIYEPSVDEVAEAALLGDMPSLDGPMDAQSKRYLDLANQLDMNREIRQRRAVADSTNQRPGMQPVESAPQEVRDLYTQHTKQRDDLTRRQTHERERFSAYTYNEVTTYASELPDGCHLSLASVLLKSKLNTSSRHMSVVGQLAQSICPELPAGTYQARDATTLSVSVKGLFEEAECIRGRQQSEWTALDALQRRQWRYKWSTQPQNLAVNGTLDQSEASMELSRTNQTEACKLTRTFPGAVVQVPGISISDCVLSVMMADQSDLLR